MGIVTYRNEHGSFRSRMQVLEVPGIGPKTFEQAAGFLRIRRGQIANRTLIERNQTGTNSLRPYHTSVQHPGHAHILHKLEGPSHECGMVKRMDRLATLCNSTDAGCFSKELRTGNSNLGCLARPQAASMVVVISVSTFES